MTELMVVFVVGLVVLGPKRLPSLARSLGRTLAEFRHASNDLRRDFMDVTDGFDVNESDPKRAIDGADGDAATATQPGAATAEQPDAAEDLSALTPGEAPVETPAEAPTAGDPHGDKDPETPGG